jgi:hypothetical protein
MIVSEDRSTLYPSLTDDERAAVDAAFDAAFDVILSHGFPASPDDVAENLVGAIARFVHDSRD